MQRYFRWRTILYFLILFLLVFTGFSFASVRIVRQQNEQTQQGYLLDTAQLVANQVQDRYQIGGDLEALALITQETRINQAINTIILDLQGNVLGSSYPLDQQSQDPLRLPAIDQARTQGQGTGSSEQTISAAVVFHDLDGEPLGFVFLEAQKESLDLNLNSILWLTIACIFIAGFALIILSMILGQEHQKQIEALTIAAEQMSIGNFRNLNYPNNAHELQRVSKALQDTAGNIDAQLTALNSEQAKLSAVLNQMTDGVLIVDDKGHVQLLNPAAERLFQVDQKDSMGRSLVEVLRYHQLVNLWRSARTGQRQSTMLEVGPQHVFLNAVAIPLSKSLQGNILLLFQDLTQLRRLETVRKDFVSNISHELRTPLASLNALVETLMEGALDDPPAARRFIRLMETEIYNLTQLVNELLDLSRIESGKLPLSFHRLTPMALIQPAYERMALQAERAGISLIQECPQDLPVVFADPDRITQVLINLIHNAIKFTPDGGRITISAYLDGEQIVFFVRDTGVGIDRKDLGRIFERFYKADQARTSVGTGLGLSIARHMIESHGGYIWAESVVGEGSTFSFSLPLA